MLRVLSGNVLDVKFRSNFNPDENLIALRLISHSLGNLMEFSFIFKCQFHTVFPPKTPKERRKQKVIA